jgi:hypothetical protein
MLLKKRAAGSNETAARSGSDTPIQGFLKAIGVPVVSEKLAHPWTWHTFLLFSATWLHAGCAEPTLGVSHSEGRKRLENSADRFTHDDRTGDISTKTRMMLWFPRKTRTVIWLIRRRRIIVVHKFWPQKRRIGSSCPPHTAAAFRVQSSTQKNKNWVIMPAGRCCCLCPHFVSK